MGTIREFISGLQNVKTQLRQKRLIASQRAAKDLLELTIARIQSTGRDKNGNPFKPYAASTKKARERAGRQTSFVDFTFKDRMWNNTFPVVTDKGDPIKITVKPILEENQIKLNAQERYGRGNILEPSDDDFDFVRKEYEKDILECFNDL